MNKICFLLFVITLLFLANTSCDGKRERETTSVDPMTQKAIENLKKEVESGTKKDNSASSNLETPVGYFTPLTFQKFQNVIDDQDNLSKFFICYSTCTPHEYAEPAILRGAMIRGGSYYETKLFSDINEYKGDYDRYNDFEIPPERVFLEETFTRQQIEQHILPYLEQHHDYFFDGSEYDGLDIPYESYGAHVHGGNNCFSLSIYEPESKINAWTISKCSDAPDPILQGLCDIMETHFMSVFED